MLQNGNTISTPQHAQVCVIGSGPAGVTAAWELSKTGVDVILLDGARELNYNEPNYYKKSWPDKTLLYNGLADGIFATTEPDFLIRGFGTPGSPTSGFPTERERVLGGTSTHWGGQSRPLDPIVFEKRKGFPGWPITREDLDPYYAKASAFNMLYGDYGTDGTNFTAKFWADTMKKQGLQAEVPNLTGFNAEMYQFMGSQWLNSATRSFDNGQVPNIRESSVRVIVNATVLNIVEQGGSVQHLNVASMNDDATNPQKATEFTVTADTYILACGAVANARQLLLSEVGGKLVGRYFMCHPLSNSNIISTTANFLSTPEQNLMNGTGWYDPSGNVNSNITPSGRFTANADTARTHDIGRCWFRSGYPGSSYRMYFEMAPNYDSFVALNDTKDPVFGQQQTHIHWAFTPLDQKTYETNCELFNSSAQPAHDGIISWPKWETLTDTWVVNGHHIGTTKMSSSTEPEKGVVDQNLKVHTTDNLYVAGSSVFPTTGVSNPTMTIMTLSIRLADYLKTNVF